MRIVADLDKITANARATVDQCARHGVSVAAVTKCVCGDPAIVRAILAGGVRTIGESRLDNVVREYPNQPGHVGRRRYTGAPGSV